MSLIDQLFPSLDKRMETHRKLNIHWQLCEGKPWEKGVRESLEIQIANCEKALMDYLPAPFIIEIEDLSKK